jgi:hypothetical protein
MFEQGQHQSCRSGNEGRERWKAVLTGNLRMCHLTRERRRVDTMTLHPRRGVRFLAMHLRIDPVARRQRQDFQCFVRSFPILGRPVFQAGETLACVNRRFEEVRSLRVDADHISQARRSERLQGTSRGEAKGIDDAWDPDTTSVSIDDALNDGKAESRTEARILPGQSRLPLPDHAERPRSSRPVHPPHRTTTCAVIA